MKERIYYQWLPGTENEGTISILNNIFIDEGEVYYEFTDGNLCWEGLISDITNDPKKLKGMAIVRISDLNNTWSFETIKNKSMNQFTGVSHDSGQTNFEIPSLSDYNKTGDFKSDEGKITFIPPKNQPKMIKKINYKDWMDINDQIKYGLISEDEYIAATLPVTKVATPPSNVMKIDNEDTISLNALSDNSCCGITVATADSTTLKLNTSEKNDKEIVNINISNDKLFDDNDPVAILVNKAAKFESIISMDLKLELPAKSLFNIASDNFENGEETFINVILSHIDYETIKNTLKTALLDAYHNE